MHRKQSMATLLFLIGSMAYAGPAELTYQGSLTGPDARPVANGAYDMSFALFDAQSSGTQLWSETDAAVLVTDGLFSTVLGDATPFGATLFSSNPALWLEVTIDTNRNSTFERPAEVYSPRQRLSSVPWAIASWATGGNPSTDPSHHFLGTTDNAALEIRVNSRRALRIEPTASSPNFIAGYRTNSVTSGVVGAAIGGGGAYGFISSPNRVTDSYGTVSGGVLNRAGDSAGATDDASHATVGGGLSNIAAGQYATIAGGYGNRASAGLTAIGGGGRTDPGDSGSSNRATDEYGTVAGGGNNLAGNGDADLDNAPYATVGGGANNTASGTGATVGGGSDNSAAGMDATVPGGYYNTANADFSFAAGYRAVANHQGAFVWADHTTWAAPFISMANNEFSARAIGGVRFVSMVNVAGAPTAGVWLPGGGTGWSAICDRNAKENFAPVNAQEILARLTAVPLQTWNLKGQDRSIRHIGPVAQDLWEAFGFGEDERYINSVDADGIALAAIQGLNEILQQKDAEIAQLRTDKVEQHQRIADLEARLARLEKLMSGLVQQQVGGE